MLRIFEFNPDGVRPEGCSSGGSVVLQIVIMALTSVCSLLFILLALPCAHRWFGSLGKWVHKKMKKGNANGDDKQRGIEMLEMPMPGASKEGEEEEGNDRFADSRESANVTWHAPRWPKLARAATFRGGRPSKHGLSNAISIRKSMRGSLERGPEKVLYPTKR